jgi:murein DD-endopeptidase MepM/ murein hydrolase activator NlpD
VPVHHRTTAGKSNEQEVELTSVNIGAEQRSAHTDVQFRDLFSEKTPRGNSGSRDIPPLWPVVGQITGRFGERLDPFSGEGAFHTGLDITTHYGDAILATEQGVVVEAQWRKGYGRLLVIDHGSGVTTWYGHLSAFNTVPGAQVRAGDIIGYEGRSGRSTGPHLHYEVRLYNRPMNPYSYLLRVNPAVTIARTPQPAGTKYAAMGD